MDFFYKMSKLLKIGLVGFLIANNVVKAQDTRQDSINTLYPGDDFSKVATSVGQFLKLEYGAAGAALGGAFTVLAAGPTALAWNPAGIALSPGPQLDVSTANLYAGIRSNFIGFVLPMTGNNYLGIGAEYLTSGPMEVTTLDFPDGTGETFQQTGLAIGLGFARQLTDRLAVGIYGKVVREQIYRETAQTIAIDIGSHFDLGIYGMTLGMAIQNFGSSMRFDGPDLNQLADVSSEIQGNPELTARLLTEKWPLPVVFRMGLAKDVLGGKSNWQPNGPQRLTLLADANDPFDNVLRGAFGFEYAFRDMFYLRGGYKWAYEWPIRYDDYRIEYNGTYDVGESFIDANGNGRWDWVDYNQNGELDAGEYEQFTDGLKVKIRHIERSSWESYYEGGRYPWRRFSLGVGLRFNLGGTKMLFDYAYVNYGILGMVEHFSMSLIF